MSPVVSQLTLANLTDSSTSLGNVTVNFGTGGLTQFADTNGDVQVNQLQQDGFAAGQLQSVSVSNEGRVVGAYSNGRNIDLAAVSVATFNGPNFLQRLDGGAFAVTNVSPARRSLRQGRHGFRLVAGVFKHRHRRRIHQADRHPAGLLRQHQGDHDREHDGFRTC